MLRISCPLLAVMLIMVVAEAVSQAINDPHEIASGRQSPDSLTFVWAEVMDNDTWCRVSWNHDDYFFQIAMDDGTAEDFMVFVNPGGMFAVRFTPTGYPVRVVGGRIYVGDGSFPGPFTGIIFRVILYDDDGEEALPGTALDSMEVTVNNYHWIDFEGLSDTITEGDFYLAMKQLAPAPDAAPIGIDCTIPTYYRSYIKVDEIPWMSAPLQDFMIRAWYTATLGGTDDSVVYQVDRFSNFDPYGSPLLGDTTHLALTGLHFYADYAWGTIVPGWYAYGVRRYAEGSGWSDYVLSNIVGTPMELISPSYFYQADTGNMPLVFCPPMDTNGVVPFNFLGYYLYLNGDFVDYMPLSITSYDPGIPSPCLLIYALTAVYDLTPYGYPYEYAESYPVQAEYKIQYGHSIPFNEDWSSGNFNDNAWEAEGPNWTLNSQSGNPVPSAQFNWDPVQTDYSMILESYPLLGNSMNSGEIYLDFDLKLSVFQPTGNEKMHIMVWNWTSQSWHIVKTLSNAEGDIPWTTNKVDITPYAVGKVFKIAFLAEGENSLNIVSWHIDNINVYRRCMGPDTVYVQVGNPYFNYISVTWPEISYDQWIQWDSAPDIKYALYRADDNNPYFLRAIVDQNIYLDDSICNPAGFHSYKVKALHILENDTCESAFSFSDAAICLGVNEIAMDSMFIYPNPSGDLFHIIAPETIRSLSMYNCTGLPVYFQEIKAKNYVLEVQDYPAGVYLLRLEMKKGTISRKVVIMR